MFIVTKGIPSRTIGVKHSETSPFQTTSVDTATESTISERIVRKDSTLYSSFNSEDFSDREQVYRKLDFTIFLLWDDMERLTRIHSAPIPCPIAVICRKSSTNYNLLKKNKDEIT